MQAPLSTSAMVSLPKDMRFSFCGSRGNLLARVPPIAYGCRRRNKSIASSTVSASSTANPVDLDVMTFSGEASGVERLALKVAESCTAKGLVHRCLITERQNARRVSVEVSTAFSLVVKACK